MSVQYGTLHSNLEESIPSTNALLVSVGSEESDAFIGQSLSYHAAWRAAGLAGRYYLQPGANHYTAIYGLGDRASPLAQMIAEFLR